MSSIGRRREIRRLAFQALFQLDARAEIESEELRAMLADVAAESAPDLSASDVAAALDLAQEAYRRRREADRAVSDLAPGWPAQRQPAVDRAILRLAFHEMTSVGLEPKVAVNEAVELAKRYSTERSPAFINGVLDKVLKRVLAGAGAAPTEGVAAPGTSGEEVGPE